MKKNSKPILVSVIVMVAIILIIARFSGTAGSQGVQIISASPGQTITYQGHGSPGSTVNLEVSATVSTGVSNNHYVMSMKGVNIPSGSRFSLSASPVSTLAVSGSFSGTGLGSSLQGTVKNNVGSISMSNLPGSSYDIVVSGIANGSNTVSITVHAYQSQNVGSDGTFTASIGTSGFPAAVYSVKQNGAEVAKIYLGVQAPATPTPTATPTPSPTAPPNGTITPTPIITPSPTAVIVISVTPTPQPSGGSFLGIQLPSLNLFGSSPSATAQPTGIINGSGTSESTDLPGSGGGSGSLVNTILIMLIAVVVGVLIGYIIVFRIFKW
jgi:hypothetical protein